MDEQIRKASIDMGTNTFQLLIANVIGDKVETIFTQDIFVRLGKGGISNGEITEEAMQRAFDALDKFQKVIKENKAEEVKVAATSAVRSANNGEDFIKDIYNRYGLVVNILSGTEEAEVIYKGVKTDTDIQDIAIIMDIGGGSVEFIIGDAEKVLWKQSFEIGAQRLYDLFCNEDPISDENSEKLADYLKEKLAPLFEESEKYKSLKFIGAAGTFQTIQEVYGAIHDCKPSSVKNVSYEEYKNMHRKFVGYTREQRFEIPGLIPQRVDMIVPASLLLFNVLTLLKVKEIHISSGSLREGLVLL
ncbi:exopolyphosphatase [Flammeovirga sp. EKP202]|uniref:Ppx/GppA phosphatase family protein n=1 Tax=Flammeovirga sp. EKP202 TaxID=2770592 RepID=UPI00165F8B2E|nr:exopolyphosphatase [Flammeovirga sp. EKP202]MBD0405422.1 exopolyphosphatase [Flammeovirga sp. EKP202]